jgi:hypothetical protein
MIGSRVVEHDGSRWAATPSGFITQFVGDEFGVVFSRLGGAVDEVRFSRYSPCGARSREASFEQLSDSALRHLLQHSQPSLRAPEGGYRS